MEKNTGINVGKNLQPFWTSNVKKARKVVGVFSNMWEVEEGVCSRLESPLRLFAFSFVAVGDFKTLAQAPTQYPSSPVWFNRFWTFDLY